MKAWTLQPRREAFTHSAPRCLLLQVHRNLGMAATIFGLVQASWGAEGSL